MKKSDFTIIKLRAQYAVLSEVCESFTPNSKHEAYIKINSMMQDILLKIEKLTIKKSNSETKTINKNNCYNVSRKS